jgi:hypothetical protein
MFLSVSIIDQAVPEALLVLVGRLLLRRKLLPTPSLATMMRSKMVVNCF